MDDAPLPRGAKLPSWGLPSPRSPRPPPADLPGCAAGPPAPCDSPAVPRSRAGICPPRGSWQLELPGSDAWKSRARAVSRSGSEDVFVLPRIPNLVTSLPVLSHTRLKVYYGSWMGTILAAVLAPPPQSLMFIVYVIIFVALTFNDSPGSTTQNWKFGSDIPDFKCKYLKEATFLD